MCLIVTGHDDCTANAEHQWQRQRWRHIWVAYGPPHGRYAWFVMLAMFGTSATDCGWLLFCSCNFGVHLLSHICISQAMHHLFWCGFLHLTWVGPVLGDLNPTLQPLRVGVAALIITHPLTWIHSLGRLNIQTPCGRLLRSYVKTILLSPYRPESFDGLVKKNMPGKLFF